MSLEGSIVASLTFKDSLGADDSLGTTGLSFSPATLKPVTFRQTINTSETALKLGDIATVGYVLLVNRDATNYVDVKVAASGAIFARLDAASNADGNGGLCLLKLGSGAQVPVLIANSAACIIEALLIPA